MTLQQRVIAGAASLLVMVFVIYLVKRRRLREEYSLLWLAACLAVFLTAACKGAIPFFARLLGIQHPAYSLFVVALFIGMVLAIHFTVVLSKLTAQNWRLTQEVGLLKAELEQAQSRLIRLEEDSEGTNVAGKAS